MSTFVEEKPTQTLEPFHGVKKVPHEEYYTSGHRTCQACESAQIMKLMAKARLNCAVTRIAISRFFAGKTEAMTRMR